MKKQILTGILALGMAAGAFAQSTVTFDNANANAAGTITSSNFGSIYINGALLNQDINMTLLAGATAGSLSQLASITFANGLANGDNTALGIAGQFLDTSGNVYNITGVAGGGVGFYEIEAWLGSAPDYATALAQGAGHGQTPIFSGGTGGGGVPPGPPVSVGDYMPALLVITPEPTTLALCGLGAASLLLFRRKK
jgi:hypothetical protein